MSDRRDRWINAFQISVLASTLVGAVLVFTASPWFFWLLGPGVFFCGAATAGSQIRNQYRRYLGEHSD